MTAIATSHENLRLIDPNPQLHAPVTLSWFEAPYGKETLLLMGNPARDITIPSIQNELHILEEFLLLDTENKQRTWMIELDATVIGVAWIELTTNHSVKAPSVHLMIGPKEHRGRGIGRTVALALINHIEATMPAAYIYSRHLNTNTPVAVMLRRIGFTKDGSSYIDDDGIEWQNVRLSSNKNPHKPSMV